jgi:hypothetical protein
MLALNERKNHKLIELPSEAIRRQRRCELEAKRKAVIAQRRAEKEEQAKRVVEFCARWEHAILLSDLCKRLAAVYCIPCNVNNVSLFKLLDDYQWKCPASGQAHSTETPISLFFVKSLSLGGSITVNNIKPFYYRGRLAGEWEIERTNIIPFPPATLAPKLETQEFEAVA